MKFWNHSERQTDEIDWTTAVAEEKIDGNLMKLFFYKAMGIDQHRSTARQWQVCPLTRVQWMRIGPGAHPSLKMPVTVVQLPKRVSDRRIEQLVN